MDADAFHRNDCQSLAVVSWNLDHGGRDGDLRQDYTRLWKQVDALSEFDADLVALQEAKWGEHSNRVLNEVSHRLGMTVRFLIPSRSHGSHLAMFVRERPGLRVVQERHAQVPYWHAQGHLELAIGKGSLRFVNIHCAPSSSTLRLIEAESIELLKDQPVIAAGDFNATPVGHGTSTPAHHKSDDRPARVLHAAGFVDVANYLGVDTPTVVDQEQSGEFAYRCDRILSTLPPHMYDSATVEEPDDPPLSNHRMITAIFHIHPDFLWQPHQEMRRPEGLNSSGLAVRP
ncbi:endonuclease/exonuclease/phosphatase family protein [Spirillospora sp. CA-294931]|uniref:endonuclease/exonuclease/phosphatase family protein n=1 Tax=Spirillospora sp. CA-294931 TaxID=3240042 RepID=UPI003D8B0EFC